MLCLAVCEAAGADAENAVQPATRTRARPHLLARPRRPACARRRRRAARSAERPRRLRRGRGAPRRRRAPRGGVRARCQMRSAGDRAGARAGDARDDRRAVPRRHRSPDAAGGAPSPQDRTAVRRGGRARPVGRRCPGGAPGPVARVRRGARRSLPGGRRRAGRRRLRGRAWRRRRTAARGGCREPGTWTARRGSGPTRRCSQSSSTGSRSEPRRASRSRSRGRAASCRSRSPGSRRGCPAPPAPGT